MPTSLERKKLMTSMLDIGEEMLKSGAEISRVEDTLTYIASAYGAKRVNVFGLVSNILVTVEFEDEEELTKTRRINKSLANDFTRLEALNSLSRRFCENNMSVDQFKNELDLIITKKQKRHIAYVGSILASASFAMFFGGNIYDAILAGFFGALICFMQAFFSPVCKNNLTLMIIVSFLTGLGIAAFSSPFPIFNPDKIMIGDIMLLVPGVAITTSVRDIFVGDTITGSIRFIESLLLAASLAVGFMLAILLAGGVR